MTEIQSHAITVESPRERWDHSCIKYLSSFQVRIKIDMVFNAYNCYSALRLVKNGTNQFDLYGPISLIGIGSKRSGLINATLSRDLLAGVTCISSKDRSVTVLSNVF